mmetsp:Transcript_13204/g.23690  ORF Transcript_13204/g.23690 Transcript_13204/m.23690 type:complete len:90 (+) Transcript_13204:131-400(+)
MTVPGQIRQPYVCRSVPSAKIQANCALRTTTLGSTPSILGPGVAGIPPAPSQDPSWGCAMYWYRTQEYSHFDLGSGPSSAGDHLSHSRQ